MIHLLWTGGWDSTYCLLDAVLTQKATVQPHFILDPDRLSTETERRTMTKIRATIAAVDGAAADRILPTIEVDRGDIPVVPELREYEAELRRAHPIGAQYVWFAEYGRQVNHLLQVGCHAGGTIEKYVDGHLTQREEAGHRHVAVSLSAPAPVGPFFRHYSFPILHMTKLEMQRTAAEAGYGHVLDQTWFCHRPRSGAPCGVCTPCRNVMKYGLSRRLPLTSRVRYYLDQVRRQGKRLLPRRDP